MHTRGLLAFSISRDGTSLLVAVLSRTLRDKPFRISGRGAPTGCVFTQCQTLSEAFALVSWGREGSDVLLECKCLRSKGKGGIGEWRLRF